MFLNAGEVRNLLDTFSRQSDQLPTVAQSPSFHRLGKSRLSLHNRHSLKSEVALSQIYAYSASTNASTAHSSNRRLHLSDAIDENSLHSSCNLALQPCLRRTVQLLRRRCKNRRPLALATFSRQRDKSTYTHLRWSSRRSAPTSPATPYSSPVQRVRV